MEKLYVKASEQQALWGRVTYASNSPHLVDLYISKSSYLVFDGSEDNPNYLGKMNCCRSQHRQWFLLWRGMWVAPQGHEQWIF